MRLVDRLRRDDGIALIAVLMLMMAMVGIAIGAVQVAEHSSNVTSVDRERLQTVEAAEAGVSEAIRRIETAGSVAAACTGVLDAARTDLEDRDQLIGQYQTKISPDASVPVDPNACVIDSWGFAPTGGDRALRHLEVQVKLIPKTGFPYTLFAEGSTGTIYVKNSGTIDGDVYAENLDQSKNNIFAKDIITTGSVITKNNAVYAGSIWAAGNVTLDNNSTVGGSITAAGTTDAGNVVLNSGTVVNGDVLAKGTITNNGTIHGASSPTNSNVPSPPNLVKPTFNENALTPYTYDNGTASNVNNQLTASRTNLSGTYRYTGNGRITMPDNVTVNGNLTVVSRGSIDLGQSMSLGTNCQSPNPPCVVAIVALGQAGGFQTDALNVPKAFTGASGLHILLYTLEGFDGKNSMTFTGSIYADAIDVKNTFTISQSDALRTDAPDGFTWDFSSSSKYVIVPTLWREVPHGTPS
jgi:cytoskeletal protein CcmA (bactofilin family)